MESIRLDKYLTHMSADSRKTVKDLIRKKQVALNGEICTRPEQKVRPGKDTVSCQGRQIPYVQYEYYLLHKPAGCVSATEDSKEKTVLDCLTGCSRKDLFPVGRLDKDTEGLLLITNDGGLAHRLLSPKKHVEKTYFARVRGAITPAHIAAFAEGLDIGDKRPTLPARLEICSEGQKESSIRVTVTEGRYHQVKRMFAAVGSEVLYLKRLSMGPLSLEEGLLPGQFRPLTKEERSSLGVR